MAKFLRRNSAIGVLRTGAAPRARSLPASVDAARGRCRRSQPRPDHFTRQTQSIEPRGIVFRQTARQQFAFPRCRRRFETFQLFDDGAHAFGPFHLMFGRDLLPGEQVTHEVGGGNRLNLLPQTIERVTVNARQQAAGAPFSFGSPGVNCPRITKPSASSFSRPSSMSLVVKTEGVGQCCRL